MFNPQLNSILGEIHYKYESRNLDELSAAVQDEWRAIGACEESLNTSANGI